MKLPYPRPRRRGDNLIPLINVVFLLLIFFMLAGTLSGPQPFSIVPPTARSEALSELEHIVVHIAVDGRVAVNGEILSKTRWPARMETMLAGRPDALVQVRADAQLRARAFLEVMRRLQAAGVQEIRLVTVQPAS